MVQKLTRRSTTIPCAAMHALKEGGMLRRGGVPEEQGAAEGGYHLPVLALPPDLGSVLPLSH